MRGNKPQVVLLILGLALLLASGCADWTIEEPTIPMLPTLTPSATVSATPAVGQAMTPTPFTPSPTLTITLTPKYTSTPPLGATSTPSENQMTATSLGPAAANAPEILYFVATPPEAEPGEPVLLFWSSKGGSSAAITRISMTGERQRSWSVPLEGSLTVIPKVVGGSEQYMLSVTNGIVTVERWVAVKVTCPLTWFFEPPPEDSCPDGEPSVSQASTQLFERGRMFWIAATDEIVVLFNIPPDAETEEPAWVMMVDPYVDGDPEDDPEIQPPDGFRQPRRGFGVVWRTVPGVRDRLGWAIGDEIEFMTTYQRETTDEGELQLYFADEAGAVIKLLAGGAGWIVVAYLE